jgi:uncharacterized protein (TIGR02453 family)
MPDCFIGFPPEGLQFLRDLGANNNKAWFEAHKHIYLHSLQAPAVALVAELGARLQAHFPEVNYDTRTNGSGSLMRIYRDTRFSADKAPYKTNIAMMFRSGQGGKMTVPGFGLQLTPEKVELVAGSFSFPPPALAAFRDAVLDDELGTQLEQAAAQVRTAGDYPISGDCYKRVPAGLPAEHPRAEWLKYRGLHIFAPEISLEVAQTPALVDTALAHFLAMAPLQRWLVRVWPAD